MTGIHKLGVLLVVITNLLVCLSVCLVCGIYGWMGVNVPLMLFVYGWVCVCASCMSMSVCLMLFVYESVCVGVCVVGNACVCPLVLSDIKATAVKVKRHSYSCHALAVVLHC